MTTAKDARQSKPGSQSDQEETGTVAQISLQLQTCLVLVGTDKFLENPFPHRSGALGCEIKFIQEGSFRTYGVPGRGQFRPGSCHVAMLRYRGSMHWFVGVHLSSQGQTLSKNFVDIMLLHLL